MKSNNITGFSGLLSTLCATFCYVGYIKKAPGTAGSFATLVVFLALFILINSFVGTYISFPQFLTVSIVICFIVGIWSIDKYTLTHDNHDPKEVVIDEVLGQLLTLLLMLPATYNLIILFPSFQHKYLDIIYVIL